MEKVIEKQAKTASPLRRVVNAELASRRRAPFGYGGREPAKARVPVGGIRGQTSSCSWRAHGRPRARHGSHHRRRRRRGRRPARRKAGSRAGQCPTASGGAAKVSAGAMARGTAACGGAGDEEATRQSAPVKWVSTRPAVSSSHELSLVKGSTTTRASWNVVNHSSMARASPLIGASRRSAGGSVATAADGSVPAFPRAHPEVPMVLAAYDDGLYKLLLLGHILSLLVAFAPAVINPILAAQSKQDGDEALHPDRRPHGGQRPAHPLPALARSAGSGWRWSSCRTHLRVRPVWVGIAIVVCARHLRCGVGRDHPGRAPPRRR